MDSFDPARTALLVVHMAKGVAGQVDTPFNRLFQQRAEKTIGDGPCSAPLGVVAVTETIDASLSRIEPLALAGDPTV